jgi:catechol 2,3-dioxygenase-like lactoylglutathione lyase family enzyme
LDSTPLIDRLDHVVVAVRDCQAATPQWARLLGCTPSWQGLQPASGTANTLFRLSNTTIELRGPCGEGPEGRALCERIDASGEGLHGLGFGSHDVAALRTSLTAAGVEAAPIGEGLGHDEPSGAWRRYRVLELPDAAAGGLPTRIVEDEGPVDLVPPAQPLQDDGSCTHAIDHVVVMTASPDRALAWYGDRLGLRLALDRTFDERGVRLIFFRTGHLTVEIAHPLHGGGDLGPDPGEGDAPDRLWGLAHQVRDAEAARARVVEAGFGATPVRTGHKPGTRVFSVEGAPSGVSTLFIEPVQRADA